MRKMMPLQLTFKNLISAHTIKTVPASAFHVQRLLSSKSKDDGSESDDGKKKPKRSEEALNKLNTLLQQMVQDDSKNMKLDLAKPTNWRKIGSEPGTKSVKSEPIEKKIVTAVKDVAESIGGNKKQTESELLSKLLNPIKENGDISTNLSDIVKGMKIDREVKASETVSRSSQVRQLLKQARSQQQAVPRQRGPRQFKHDAREDENNELHMEPIDVFGSESLGIFTAQDLQESKLNSMWEKLNERELKLAVTHPPNNYFQEQILWTEQGKLWKFPVDNEQGMEEEQNVYFADHVFVEKYLEPWCPEKGPIRHFMELVCVGLSKNCYLTVTEKKEHIEWFKNYFEDKKKLLLQVGAIPADSGSVPKQKQIKSE